MNISLHLPILSKDSINETRFNWVSYWIGYLYFCLLLNYICTYHVIFISYLAGYFPSYIVLRSFNAQGSPLLEHVLSQYL